MTHLRKSQQTIEFGDFQTPYWFAERVCKLLIELGCQPTTLIEPTCGVGTFLLAGLKKFPNVQHGYGIEINSAYAASSRLALASAQLQDRATIINRDFFDVNWHSIGQDEQTTLFIGNPPWVTNSALSKLQSSNLPPKSNFRGLAGIEAITGSSNFDISEWMLLELLNLRHTKKIVLAMLCKTSVARKLLKRLWQESAEPIAAKLFRIDANKVFGANVDACLLYIDTAKSAQRQDKICEVYASLDLSTYESTFGYRNNALVARTNEYDQWSHLVAEKVSEKYRWRSGVKHDCADVMELHCVASGFRNRGGAVVEDLEEDYLFPMLKSSDIAKWPATTVGKRWMLVTQKTVGQETKSISVMSPKTWGYLLSNSERLDARKSSIYKDKPRFSVFGVGNYTFSKWKIAISGLYKTVNFALIGPHKGKPVVLDDTCYLLACGSEQEARIIHAMLSSKPAKEFYRAYIFWDAKRPITTKLLNRLDINKLAQECGVADELAKAQSAEHGSHQTLATQIRLLEETTYPTIQ